MPCEVVNWNEWKNNTDDRITSYNVCYTKLLRVVKDIMQKPITIENSLTLSHVIHKFIESKKSRLLTTNKEGKIVGIITQKDLGFFLFANNTEKTLEEIPVSNISKP